jgi:hypothetical protein
VAWYSQRLARALCDRGARVAVVAPRDGGPQAEEQDGSVLVRRAFERGRSGALRAVGAALDTGAPVVHVQHEAFLYGGPDSVPAVLGAMAGFRRAGKGPVVTMHQVVDPKSVDRAFTRIHRVNVPAPFARAGLAAMQRSVARLASRLVVHEDAFRRVVPGARVFPLGGNTAPPADQQVITRAAELRVVATTARPAGGTLPGLLVLCFGFVAPYKGLETALEAARLAGPPISLVVAGGEHPRLAGQGYLDGLRARYGQVAHFTGFVPEEDVAAWFEAADAVLLPYPQPFSSSGVLADAAAHGVPVLVSPALARVTGMPADVAVPVDPPGLSARLLELAARPEQLVRLAAVSTALNSGRSWTELADRHLALYEEVIDAQRPARRPVPVGSGR